MRAAPVVIVSFLFCCVMARGNPHRDCGNCCPDDGSAEGCDAFCKGDCSTTFSQHPVQGICKPGKYGKETCFCKHCKRNGNQRTTSATTTEEESTTSASPTEKASITSASPTEEASTTSASPTEETSTTSASPTEEASITSASPTEDESTTSATTEEGSTESLSDLD